MLLYRGCKLVKVLKVKSYILHWMQEHCQLICKIPGDLWAWFFSCSPFFSPEFPKPSGFADWWVEGEGMATHRLLTSACVCVQLHLLAWWVHAPAICTNGPRAPNCSHKWGCMRAHTFTRCFRGLVQNSSEPNMGHSPGIWDPYLSPLGNIYSFRRDWGLLFVYVQVLVLLVLMGIFLVIVGMFFIVWLLVYC